MKSISHQIIKTECNSVSQNTNIEIAPNIVNTYFIDHIRGLVKTMNYNANKFNGCHMNGALGQVVKMLDWEEVSETEIYRAVMKLSNS